MDESRKTDVWPLSVLLTMQSADMWTDPLWAATTSPDGWHGTRLRWRLRRINELQAINKTVAALTP